VKKGFRVAYRLRPTAGEHAVKDLAIFRTEDRGHEGVDSAFTVSCPIALDALTHAPGQMVVLAALAT